jgi:hypothetical protein
VYVRRLSIHSSVSVLRNIALLYFSVSKKIQKLRNVPLFPTVDVEATPASPERHGRVQVGHLEQMLQRRMEMESDNGDKEDEE